MKLKQQKKNSLLIIFFITSFFLLISCNKKIYVKYENNEFTEIEKNRFKEHLHPHSICIIFENSMKDKQIEIYSYNTQKTLFNDKLSNTTSIGLIDIIFVENLDYLFLTIDNKSKHLIERRIYEKYKYITVSMIKKGKYKLIYSNQISNRW